MSGIPAKTTRIITKITEIEIRRSDFMAMLRDYLRENTCQVKSIPKHSEFSMTYDGRSFMDEFNKPINIRWVEQRNMDTGEDI